jgi:hypothetical protein
LLLGVTWLKESVVVTTLGVRVLVASLLVTPAASPLPRGGGPEWPASLSTQGSSPTVATHATKGVVKSIDSTSLVIIRSTRRAKEQTFAIDDSTRQVGRVTIGATVEIRYRSEDGRRLATVVSVQEAKPPR